VTQPRGTGMLADWPRFLANSAGMTWVCGPKGVLPSCAGISAVTSMRPSAEMKTRAGCAALIAAMASCGNSTKGVPA
jgi:hypothetical protein